MVIYQSLGGLGTADNCAWLIGDSTVVPAKKTEQKHTTLPQIIQMEGSGAVIVIDIGEVFCFCFNTATIQYDYDAYLMCTCNTSWSFR